MSAPFLSSVRFSDGLHVFSPSLSKQSNVCEGVIWIRQSLWLSCCILLLLHILKLVKPGRFVLTRVDSPVLVQDIPDVVILNLGVVVLQLGLLCTLKEEVHSTVSVLHNALAYLSHRVDSDVIVHFARSDGLILTEHEQVASLTILH